MTPTVPSPPPSSMTGRLILEAQHGDEETVDCSERTRTKRGVQEALLGRRGVRGLVLGVAADAALRQCFLQLVNLSLGEVRVVFEIQLL